MINSSMLPNMKKDADGGLTIYIQSASLSSDKESNWLPAPQGPFAAYIRLYWLAEAALDGSWAQPKLIKTESNRPRIARTLRLPQIEILLGQSKQIHESGATS
ncbi:DUF1214 domain-containing protein [Oceanisphaera sp. W20_SRM_FM3]|uniref:DUF1214 domain-containing protein n=1 Tax=Oceanisphaera sp. W20_SRM_FM3 TaxID=3240267 RepID=UPI003F97EAB3